MNKNNAVPTLHVRNPACNFTHSASGNILTFSSTSASK